MNALWWTGAVVLIVAAWLGMEQLTWMQELRPGLDSLVRVGLSTVVLGAAAVLNPFDRAAQVGQARRKECRCGG
ncbi:hypothetical protein [Ornithinimicrobium panacihumi]|uniref:hypothetical protein n=1 Tax=Ornithinimicrobium panacihumi TaxID=2008449 RepID=UPI003F8C968A